MSAGNGRACGEDAAAYVLGALEPAEADAFRRHIAECVVCREEVAAFEHVTEALPPAGSARYEVPKALRRRVMREVRATPKTAPVNRRRGIRLPTGLPLAWGGALAAVVVAVIVAIALGTGGSSGTQVIQASVGSAQLRIAGGHADLIVHRLAQPPRGRIYEMWVQRGGAQPEPTGTLFSTTSTGTASVGVPGGLHGVSAVMVTQEPAGGTSVPTSAPVIVARVS
jgi:anti-sigma-K factor RskA